MSPYVITTKRERHCTCWGREDLCVTCQHGRLVVSRRAVATLEEARKALLRIDDSLYATAMMVPESGGTVGPLPDGTVIEVESDPHTATMRKACPFILQTVWDRMSVQERCDAYNARQGQP